MDVAHPHFLHVPTLLESSQPRGRSAWIIMAPALTLMLTLGASLMLLMSGHVDRRVAVLGAAVMLAAVAAMGTWATIAVARRRAETARVQAAGELVLLRRWPQAAMLLEHLLAQPANSPTSRTQALVYLAMVLARYHRFDDAVSVYDYLLEERLVQGGAEFAVRMARAMAIIRQEHLFDADRAISELRRMKNEGHPGALALVEMYRDVKTGHFAEAVEIFETSLPDLCEGLGHRMADAWALAACAYHQLGRRGDAQASFAKASLLMPLPELTRRYTEVEKLLPEYKPAAVPAGLI